MFQRNTNHFSPSATESLPSLEVALPPRRSGRPDTSGAPTDPTKTGQPNAVMRSHEPSADLRRESLHPTHLYTPHALATSFLQRRAAAPLGAKHATARQSWHHSIHCSSYIHPHPAQCPLSSPSHRSRHGTIGCAGLIPECNSGKSVLRLSAVFFSH